MIATHKVVNTDTSTVGYIVDRVFKRTETVKKLVSLGLISNLTLTKDGKIRAVKRLQELKVTTINKNKLNLLKRENPYERDVQKEIENWYRNNKRTVLLVEGAVGVGKTTEVLKFVYSKYSSVIYIDVEALLNSHETMREIVKKTTVCSKLQFICEQLELPNFVNSRQTVVILDNIEKSEKAQSMLSQMRNVMDCSIIAISNGVGMSKRIGAITTKIVMEDMNFEEVKRAIRATEANNGLSWKVYTNIGGYPSVIRAFNCESKHRDSTDDVIMETIARIEMTLDRNPYNRDIARLAWSIIQNDAINAKFTMKHELMDKIFEQGKKNGKTYSAYNIGLVIEYMKDIGILGETYKARSKEKEPIRKILFIRNSGVLAYILEKSYFIRSENNEAYKAFRNATAVINEIIKTKLNREPSVAIMHDNRYIIEFNGVDVYIKTDKIAYNA